MQFENLKFRLAECRDNPDFARTKDGAVALFCADCDFYKESDKDLECGAFRLLRLLVESGTLTLDQIRDALGK